MLLYPEIAIDIGYIAISIILFSISSTFAILLSIIIIYRTERKINREKHTFRKSVYRPLEFIFILFLFLATLFITLAMKFYGKTDIESALNYMYYWSISIFFYASSICVGYAHYVRGIYVK
jgi:hypothetical protein